MHFRYDKEADAVSIWFRDIKPCRTVDLAEDIFMDVDENGRLAGIEILNASEKTNLIDFTRIAVEFPDDQTMEVTLPKLSKT